MSVDRVFEAYLDRLNSITILMPHSYYGGQSSLFKLYDKQHSWELEIKGCEEIDGYNKYYCVIDAFLEIGETYIIKDQHDSTTDLQIGAVIRTEEFDDAYYYDGDDLGVTYHQTLSKFKLWAPTASQVTLILYQEQTNREEVHKMNRGSSGVWELVIDGNLEGYLYKYHVCVNLVWREAVDPYAKALTINSEFGVIVDLHKTTVEKSILPQFQHPTDAIIYETHIRDFSIHPNSGIQAKGKYLGLTEIGTNGSQGTNTGLSYLLELGITHVELLPFNDFGGVDEKNPNKFYNWGYNPLFFNAPEGSYATDPYDPYARINELKKTIQVLNYHGIRVIMDVVYNHVYIREESSFEKIVPGYYFRHDLHGMPSNGTGVGNDIASERKMVRKFIIDSILYWINEYKIDGLRFDLMGILDIDTMNTIRRAVDELDPSILIFGEGWDLNTPLPYEKKAVIGNARLLPGIGQFNDRFRDVVKGSTFNLYDRGYCLGNTHKDEGMKQSIAGSISLGKGEKGLFFEPSQTINYVESHDNHTLWDKMAECNSKEDFNIRRRRQRLATSIVLLSQGIPFIHSGQEFYRTKQGIENSYKSPDHINWLDWDRKEEFIDEVNYVKGLIMLRKAHAALRLPTASLIRKHIKFHSFQPGIIGYSLNQVKHYGPWNRVLVIHNNLTEPSFVDLPGDGAWEVICDKEHAGITKLYTIKDTSLEVSSISTFVMCQN
ncbi:type I pullulanase [Litchfieldia alkalitelluris]|uniref:type I pullulanase n=1 Tax=Litchfieldia alkalitelluris TaxID=304268 RepID=UPI001474818D|nr:type I pullulanase [Litchfieldia alkalitelluris]